ncbi:ester cyclase [Singulisphaera rosea]
MPHQTADVVRKWFEDVWNARREEMIDDLITSESVCYTDDGVLRGPVEFKERQYWPFLAAFPDLHVDVEAIVSEGENVVVRWTAEGTHAGEGIGLAPTHERVRFRGITWIQVRGDKLMQGWQSSNIPEVIRTLASAAT